MKDDENKIMRPSIGMSKMDDSLGLLAFKY
jgi:hypothetical protein